VIEYKKITPLLLLFVVLLVVIVGALFTANYVEDSATAQLFVLKLWYFGVVVIAIVAGLNVILPIPAFTLTPIFSAAGLGMTGIILALAVGTFIADILGFLFGNWSREHIYRHYPKVIRFLEKIYINKPRLIVPVIFLYAAFVPFPNEVLIIPLALLKVHLRLLLIPLFLGSLVHQAIYAYGMQGIFSWLF
jgi:uncharacterized membrane protein YdjX (TVP38/TMEM64 family)